MAVFATNRRRRGAACFISFPSIAVAVALLAVAATLSCHAAASGGGSKTSRGRRPSGLNFLETGATDRYDDAQRSRDDATARRAALMVEFGRALNTPTEEQKELAERESRRYAESLRRGRAERSFKGGSSLKDAKAGAKKASVDAVGGAQPDADDAADNKGGASNTYGGEAAPDNAAQGGVSGEGVQKWERADIEGGVFADDPPPSPTLRFASASSSAADDKGGGRQSKSGAPSSPKVGGAHPTSGSGSKAVAVVEATVKGESPHVPDDIALGKLGMETFCEYVHVHARSP